MHLYNTHLYIFIKRNKLFFFCSQVAAAQNNFMLRQPLIKYHLFRGHILPAFGEQEASAQKAIGGDYMKQSRGGWLYFFAEPLKIINVLLLLMCIIWKSPSSHRLSATPP